MSKERVDVCEACCKWVHKCEGKSPAYVRDTYPKMMRVVLKEKFGMPKKAASVFIAEACNGNWERLHETNIEEKVDAATYADYLVNDVWYCSDRWSWDRVIRVQWAYQRLVDRCRREME